MSESAIAPEAFETLIRETIPLANVMPMRVLELERGRAVVELGFRDEQLRAGGTMNGPSMMTLADTALYAAVLSVIGNEPLAVTSDLSVRFLAKPSPGPLRAEALVLREGSRSIVGEIRLFSGAPPVLVAFATGAYAVPSKKRPA